jgi:hypothetical protein
MKCKCNQQRMNTAYVYRKNKGKGVWETIGYYCVSCGHFAGLKKLKLSESLRTTMGNSTTESRFSIRP